LLHGPLSEGRRKEAARVDFPAGDRVVRVNMPDGQAVIRAVAERLSAAQGFALATLNLDHLVKLRSDRAFARAYAAQDFVCADGNPIVWLAGLAGQRIALVPGSDLVLPLVTAARDAGRPVVLCGGTADSLAAAERALAAGVPGVRFGPCIAPPMGFDAGGAPGDAVLGQIADVGPCLCLLALGAPRQEILAARGRLAAPEAGFVSIGAGLDFLAGSQRRAPQWVRRIAMEWLWRMLSDPSRLFLRYLRCALILPGLAWSALRQRR
jgi:N-acetylglucosaminyldiphosphoundecaprenol N-acetyl-beta-D-mannosaminyltransferase